MGFESGDLQNFASIRLRFVVDQVSKSEFVLFEMVDMGNRLATKGLTDERHIFSFNVSHDHDLLLGQIMERQFIDSISQDGFLHKQNIGTGLIDLDDHLGDILLLLSEDTIDILMGLDSDCVLDISLGRG